MRLIKKFTYLTLAFIVFFRVFCTGNDLNILGFFISNRISSLIESVVEYSLAAVEAEQLWKTVSCNTGSKEETSNMLSWNTLERKAWLSEQLNNRRKETCTKLSEWTVFVRLLRWLDESSRVQPYLNNTKPLLTIQVTSLWNRLWPLKLTRCHFKYTGSTHVSFRPRPKFSLKYFIGSQNRTVLEECAATSDNYMNRHVYSHVS